MTELNDAQVVNGDACIDKIYYDAETRRRVDLLAEYHRQSDPLKRNLSRSAQMVAFIQAALAEAEREPAFRRWQQKEAHNE